MRQTLNPIDLNEAFGTSQWDGSVVDFQVAKRQAAWQGDDGTYHPAPTRRLLVREDNGEVLGACSRDYQVVQHIDVLRQIDRAVEAVGLRDADRGVHISANGAKIAALYRFDELKMQVKDQVFCPMISVKNSFDLSSRVKIEIGAFSFVCTNLAFGGGGCFGGGFHSLHVGEINIEIVGSQLLDYLTNFTQIMRTYERWMDTPTHVDHVFYALGEAKPPKMHLEGIRNRMALERDRRGKRYQQPDGTTSVYQAYDAATDYATHGVRSASVAFNLLALINGVFQESFPKYGAAQPLHRSEVVA